MGQFLLEQYSKKVVFILKIEALDHFVLTVKNIQKTCDFYEQVLGMKTVEFKQGRLGLMFGKQKINLHEAGQEFEPKASKPTPGSADLCFLTSIPMENVIKHLQQKGVVIEEGPVTRTGAQEELLSVYIRDPDENLIEISNGSSTTYSSN